MYKLLKNAPKKIATETYRKLRPCFAEATQGILRWREEWRRHPDLNRGMAVLQTAALGHLAMPPWNFV
jgi:hypothetical protein